MKKAILGTICCIAIFSLGDTKAFAGCGFNANNDFICDSTNPGVKPLPPGAPDPRNPNSTPGAIFNNGPLPGITPPQTSTPWSCSPGDGYSKFLDHLKHREGVVNCVYLDSLGKPTVGVGHLVLPADGLSVGDCITDAQVNAFLTSDATAAWNAATNQVNDIKAACEDPPKPVQPTFKCSDETSVDLDGDGDDDYGCSWEENTSNEKVKNTQEIASYKFSPPNDDIYMGQIVIDIGTPAADKIVWISTAPGAPAVDWDGSWAWTCTTKCDINWKSGNGVGVTGIFLDKDTTYYINVKNVDRDGTVDACGESGCSFDIEVAGKPIPWCYDYDIDGFMINSYRCANP